MNRRWNWIIAILLLWSMAALCKAFFLAGPGRASRIEEAFKMASGRGRIPARRGTVYDRLHTPVIWDELRFELLARRHLTKKEKLRLNRTLGYDLTISENDRLLLSDLSPDEIKTLQPLIRQGFPIRINCKRERIFAVSAHCREKLQKIELLYDKKLSGSDGRYIVLLDRFRNWIPGSWKLMQKPVPGEDVTIKETISELEAQP